MTDNIVQYVLIMIFESKKLSNLMPANSYYEIFCKSFTRITLKH